MDFKASLKPAEFYNRMNGLVRK